jgi:hypothetical protein
MSDSRKSERHVEAGRLGASVRWGPPRNVRLADLTPPQRRLIVALVAAVRQTSDPKDEGSR